MLGFFKQSKGRCQKHPRGGCTNFAPFGRRMLTPPIFGRSHLDPPKMQVLGVHPPKSTSRDKFFKGIFCEPTPKKQNKSKYIIKLGLI